MQSETTLNHALAKDLRYLIRRNKVQLVQFFLKKPLIMSTKSLRDDPLKLMDQPAITFNAKDEQMTEHDIEQNKPEPQTHYQQFWKEVRKISNNDLKQELKAIMAITEPVHNHLQNSYSESKKELLVVQHNIRQLYLQCHQMYGLIQGVKAQQLKFDIKRKQEFKDLKQKHKNLLSSQLYNLLPSHQEFSEFVNRNNSIKKKIAEINKEIDIQTEKAKAIRKIIKSSKRNLIKFLRQGLKNGLDCRQKGICWMVSQLLDLGQTVEVSDLPNQLDEKAKKIIIGKGKKQLNQYHSSRANINIQKKGRSLRHTNKLPSLSTIRTLGVAKSLANIGQHEQIVIPSESQIKKLYADTKEIIGQIIKDRDSALNIQNSASTILISERQARMSSYSPQNIQQNNDFIQYQRVLSEFPRNTYRTALKMLFGFKRPTMKRLI